MYNILVWIGTGITGATIMYVLARAFRITDDGGGSFRGVGTRRKPWCPTPFNLLLIIFLGGTAGPLTLIGVIVFLVGVLLDLLDNSDTFKIFMNTPICDLTKKEGK